MASPYDSYDFRRAEFEMAMARKSSDPAAIRVHQELAARYLERCAASVVDRMAIPLPRL